MGQQENCELDYSRREAIRAAEVDQVVLLPGARGLLRALPYHVKVLDF